MNDLLKSALQTKYKISKKESQKRIDKAKNQGKLLELYQMALMKFEMEMSENV